MVIETGTDVTPIDCACVIHSNGYNWQYVERLYNMLVRNLSRPVRFHVYTEADRAVPAHMIKHELIEWSGVSGPKQSWWYKMQMFNSAHHRGQMLYFDLDVVITGSLDWIVDLPQRNFWAIHDFRRLWKKSSRTINSSVMYFNTQEHGYIWNKFQQQPIGNIINTYKGDQDFITEAVDTRHLRYFDLDRIVSWRWQVINPGTRNRRPISHGNVSNTQIPDGVSVVVFHGNPKPHEVDNTIVKSCWQ